MLNRRTFTALTALAPLAMRERSAAAASDLRITLAQPSHGFLYLPIYVARGLDYFRDQGLNVEVTVFEKGASAALTAVLAGENDVYVGLPAVPLQAWMKGRKTLLFAALLSRCGSDIVLSAKAADRVRLAARRTPKEKAEALNGLKIAVAGPGSITDLVVRNVATYGGLEPDRDMTIIPIGGGSNMLSAFGQGRVDGYCLSAPTSTIGIAKMGGVRLFDFAKDEYPPLNRFLFTALSANESWLSSNRDAAVRLVRALGQALDAMRERPDAAREAVRSFYPQLEPAILDQAWEQAAPAFTPDLTLDPAGIERNFEFLGAVRTSQFNLPVDQLFTNDIVKLAAQPTTAR